MIFPVILLDPGLLRNGCDQQYSFKQCKKKGGLSLLLDVEGCKMSQHESQEDGVTA